MTILKIRFMILVIKMLRFNFAMGTNIRTRAEISDESISLIEDLEMELAKCK